MQVGLTQQAGEAASSLATDIPALLVECSAVPAMLTGRSASIRQAGSACQTRDGAQTAAEAWERRTHARQKVHAELVHSRFMRKLMGTHHVVAGESDMLPVSASLAAAGEELLEDGSVGPQDGQGKALCVSEQVEVLMQEATSLDNLAQMYEGWSAWI